MKRCSFCHKWHQEETALCEICRDKSRHRETLCIVEKQPDLASIEEAHLYRGLYFVLGDNLFNLKKEEKIEKIVKDLKNKIKNPFKYGLSNKNFKEIILATNPNTPGEATALYLERNLKELKVKTTRLGKGLPTGGEVEYADRETLFSAFENRK